jgi:tRNA threonylcarbamoyladenosine modification (KEOPS) complex  Pcc1 subunit
MRKVEISIELPQAERKIVLGSLLPETGRTVQKTLVNLTETDTGIILTIETDTTSALRAALNSYLRWLNCIFSINSSIKED